MRLRWLIPGALATNLAATACGALLFALVSSSLYDVASSSMEPTLHCPRGTPGDERCLGAIADEVVVSPIPYWYTEPKRGDIVAFAVPAAARYWCDDTRVGDIFVKRIVGMPGETIEERRGVIFVNGTRLHEPYVHRERARRSSHARQAIPPRHYFLLGDDRVGSCDSRLFGPVPRENVHGKVVLIW